MAIANRHTNQYSHYPFDEKSKDIEIAKTNIREDARSFIKSISRVCQAVDLPDDNHVGASWPSHIYFEDINGESHFDLVEIVLEEVYGSIPFRD